VKKIFLIFTALFLSAFFLGFNTSYAKSEKAKGFDKTAKPTATTASNNEEDNPPALNQGEDRQVRSTIRKMERLMEKIGDPAVSEEVEGMTEEQERLEVRAEVALEKMQGRPGFLKFILGPDYKNAGEVRSQIVRIRNQIRQMTRLENRVDSEEGKTSLQDAVAALEEKAKEIENKLTEALSGFSLFGWLARLLSGYMSSEPVLTPLPEATLSASPTPETTPVPAI